MYLEIKFIIYFTSHVISYRKRHVLQKYSISALNMLSGMSAESLGRPDYIYKVQLDMVSLW